MSASQDAVGMNESLGHIRILKDLVKAVLDDREKAGRQGKPTKKEVALLVRARFNELTHRNNSVRTIEMLFDERHYERLDPRMPVTVRRDGNGVFFSLILPFFSFFFFLFFN